MLVFIVFEVVRYVGSVIAGRYTMPECIKRQIDNNSEVMVIEFAALIGIVRVTSVLEK